VQLRWNYGANGLADADVAEIKVFAIEMVYVPQGAFYVGSGGTELGSLTNGSWTGGATIPLLISSENELTIAQTAGNLWGTSTSPDNTIGGAGTLAAAFPKGYDAFYCMKYEMSQQQYVDFLNTITSTQASNRYSSGSTGYRYGISVSGGVYSTTTPYVACNWLSWMDGAAYTDWAGLRPMTELEFEKACRGTATPVAGEYAWGNTAATKANNITNGGANNETTNTPNANAVYLFPSGPMRTGVFATGSTTRVQAGGTYYGIMEMTGNLWERPVTVGNAEGRVFTGVHGDGLLSADGHATETAWPGLSSGEVTDATGSGLRGGSFTDNYMNISNRELGSLEWSDRFQNDGFRAVRTQPLPKLTTTEATSITTTTATSGGNVTSDGGGTITARGVCWSTTTKPTADLTTKTTETGTTGVFTSNLSDLTSNTTYYVRAYATNSAGTSYGNEVSFTTSPPICFIVGTKISMANGTVKNIEDIVVGDEVKSVNTETMEIVSEIVTNTFANPPAINLTKIIFSNGLTNTNTKEHPYWVVGKGWSCVDPEAYDNSKPMSTELLAVGDQCLVLENGKLVTVTITAIEDQPQLTIPTFNFKVNQTNCYFANGVLVHNKV